jgi:hypothetical protein
LGARTHARGWRAGAARVRPSSGRTRPRRDVGERVGRPPASNRPIEALCSPGVATSGNQPQIDRARKQQKQANGKEGSMLAFRCALKAETWYRNWYLSQRTSPHLERLKRGRNPASVLGWTFRDRPSKPVRRGSPTLGRFDSCAAPYQRKAPLTRAFPPFGRTWPVTRRSAARTYFCPDFWSMAPNMGSSLWTMPWKYEICSTR